MNVRGRRLFGICLVGMLFCADCWTVHPYTPVHPDPADRQIRGHQPGPEVLEDRTFERVGGTRTLEADARVIAATNRDLAQMVGEGTFREDLYFRLQTFPVTMPPLRERYEDIPLLATYFMGRMAAHLNKQVAQLMPDALQALKAYDWPGNVRELEHAIQRAVIVCQGEGIGAEDIALGMGDREPAEAFVTLVEYERRYIRKVLEKTGWVIRGAGGAATVLGLHEATLRSRMKKLGIVRPQA